MIGLDIHDLTEAQCNRLEDALRVEFVAALLKCLKHVEAEDGGTLAEHQYIAQVAETLAWGRRGEG